VMNMQSLMDKLSKLSISKTTNITIIQYILAFVVCHVVKTSS
jgi:hypothetical protein